MDHAAGRLAVADRAGQHVYSTYRNGMTCKRECPRVNASWVDLLPLPGRSREIYTPLSAGGLCIGLPVGVVEP